MSGSHLGDRVRSFDREVEARLRAIRGIKTISIGSAVHDGDSYPILACLVSGDGRPDRPWVLISGGVHGDEVAGVFAALEFLETRRESLAGRLQIAVLPCINPSGFERNTLQTANGANLNRLFGTGSLQPEVVAIESWLNRLQRRYLATFDLHEIKPDYRGEGFNESDNPRECYLYELQADHKRRIGRAMIDAIRPFYEVCRWHFIYHDRNDAGVVSYPEACNNAIYAEHTTFDAYLNGRFTNHSFTFETPMGWSLQQRVAAQLIWLDAGISQLLATIDP